jgi:hypothetical protein
MFSLRQHTKFFCCQKNVREKYNKVKLFVASADTTITTHLLQQKKSDVLPRHTKQATKEILCCPLCSVI